MKIGVIIVFGEDNDCIPTDDLINHINDNFEIEFCLVNNMSDIIQDELIQICNNCDNANVIYIRRKKSFNFALRAGTRYLSSISNLNQITYIKAINSEEIIKVMRVLTHSRNEIIAKIIEQRRTDKVKPTLFQSLLSIS